MNKDSKALFAALQKKKGAKDIKPLVTKDTAKAKDIYYGMTPLFWALSYGASADVLQLLLDAYPEAAGEKHPVGGWTPLHYAEKLGAEAVKLLIQKCPGAAKEKDKDGELPLHWAAEHNAPAAVIKQLLEAYKGAAAEEDKLGRLPIKLAMDNSASDDIVSMLSEANPKASAAALVPEVQEEALPVALLFPGQGSQYVGMLEEAKSIPAVAAMLEEATEILGYDLLKICLEGPEDKLQDTVYCQPAMYVAGLAAVEKLRLENPEAARRPQAVAGLSLGEYTALTAAGVFTFADGLKLVKERAEAMQEAANTKPQAMLSVAGLDEKKVNKLCAEAIKKAGGGDAICQVSNYLFQKGYTIGGTKQAVEECQQLAEKAKALQARLIKASGGFHTALMEPAKVRLEKKLQEMLPKMKRPRCKVFMNVTAQPVDMYTDTSQIIDLLAKQLTSAVQWKGCVEAIIADGVTEYHECGPMKQLKAMMKRIDNGAWGKTQNVEV